MNGNALGIVAPALGMAGCASQTPMLDESFGDAARAERVAQTPRPDAGHNADAIVGLDGVAVKESVGRYYGSFK